MKHAVIVAVGGWLCLAPFVVAQEPAPPEKTGLKIGEKAPAFKLRDQAGKQRTFDDLSKNASCVARERCIRGILTAAVD
jgi:hypothetical protein